ncbi:MAG TPA: tyrosine--tRNA ligase [Firmicutes bacterium]|nr:tyrosine--tRNA ligase [Bacillota bacterium]
MDQIQELLERSVADIIVREKLEADLRSGKRLRVKLGIDPTGPRIHLGRSVPLRKLLQFQKLGHLVQLVVGDFTGQIGDSSDKDAQRPMLTPEAVRGNMAGYQAQIGKILDLDQVEFHYNSTWLAALGFQDVVQLTSHFTVAQMLERENFALRYQSEKPIGLHELLYPLMQGYDSVALKTDVELGGTDQIFNLMAGRTLQRVFDQEPQSVLTNRLIEGTDGRKMSTSWGNVITILDPPDEQYGKCMSIKDELIFIYLEACTDMPMSDLEQAREAFERGELHPMEAKKRLAWEIVAQYHGAEEAQEAAERFAQVVQRKEQPDEMPVVRLAPSPVDAVTLLCQCNLVSSKSEGRRLIEQGGLNVDGLRITDPNQAVVPIAGMIIKAGKRKYARLEI